MKNVAIFASGDGTTAEAFIKANLDNKYCYQVRLIICNNPRAGIFARVNDLNQKHKLQIKTQLINSQTHPLVPNELIESGSQTSAEELAIHNKLLEGNFDLIVLMGYMKKIGPNLVNQFGWKSKYTSPYQAMMLNTHPGLLPDTKGLYGRLVQKYVLDRRLPYAGQTLHVVAKEYDDGPIITEHKVALKPDDTPESLFDRIKITEKKFLPQDIDKFIKNRQNYLQGVK